MIGRGVHDPTVALAEATLFLMPSRNEGMPVALAEALVAGVPCIVADSPGLRWASADAIVLPLHPEKWLQALRSAGTGVAIPQIRIDFSAERGVREYLAVYGPGRNGRSLRGISRQ